VTAVTLDVVPQAARPPEVERLLSEAQELRAHHREADEQLKQAQQALEQAEADDVARAAERIRSGQAPGSLSQAISKARSAVDVAQRTAAAVDLASRAASDELATAMQKHADGWIEALDEQRQEARARALQALDAFETATAELRDAASAASWVRSGDWGRPPRGMVIGSMSASSRRITANSHPLTLDQLIGFVRETLDEPAPPARQDLSPPEPLDAIERSSVR
jgi:hypothetical protein